MHAEMVYLRLWKGLSKQVSLIYIKGYCGSELLSCPRHVTDFHWRAASAVRFIYKAVVLCVVSLTGCDLVNLSATQRPDRPGLSCKYPRRQVIEAATRPSFRWCLMSSDVGWHIRDKLRPMREHGSVLFYVHRNRKVRKDGQPRTATSTLTQLLNYEATRLAAVLLER